VGGAEVLGDLDREPSGGSRCAEDQDALSTLKSIRRRSATHDDIAGFIAAATTTGSRSSGIVTLRCRSMRTRSAIEPRWVSGRRK